MINFKCELCEGDVNIDLLQTVEMYSMELGYEVEAGEIIIEETLQDYLIYRCLKCNHVEKFTLEEVDLKIRKAAAAMALEGRRIINFKRYAKHVDLDSGLEFCGLCGGVDEARDGTCIKSLMAHCFIRRKHLNKSK